MRLAIIPARGGSKRIPRKNIRLFHGEPIIAYSIRAAGCIFEQVWVSTEDQEIAEVAVKYSAHVLYRPLELADDESGTQDVMMHAMRALPKAEVACCIYPCAPMIEPRSLQAALERLLQNHASYVVPVATWLRDPGQFYMGTADAFRRGLPLVGPKTLLLQVDPKTECDINTEDDWKRAERMYAAARSGVAA